VIYLEGQLVVQATLCWILKDGKVLLKLANAGISDGKWNGVGGKMEPGETPEECARRETLEESGLTVGRMTYHGRIEFYFVDEDSSDRRHVKDWVMHVFSTDDFTGNIMESGEGKLKWFDLNSIPYDKMWEDDMHWVPLMLEGKKFNGRFTFSKDGSRMLDKHLDET
jgi:8-oxo-dGTP diphosphatase